MGVKSYLDPSVPVVSYRDLSTSSKGPKLGVIVEFQTDGKPNPEATAIFRRSALATLTKTNVFVSVDEGAVASGANLKIVMNNTGGTSTGSGVATGLTFGAVGTNATDRYIISVAYQRVDGKSVAKEYRRELYTGIGNAQYPSGVKLMTMDEAVNTMFEQVVLQLVKDLQHDGDV
jgi:hypothetical protein